MSGITHESLENLFFSYFSAECSLMKLKGCILDKKIIHNNNFYRNYIGFQLEVIKCLSTIYGIEMQRNNLYLKGWFMTICGSKQIIKCNNFCNESDFVFLGILFFHMIQDNRKF